MKQDTQTLEDAVDLIPRTRSESRAIHKVAMTGNHTPRQCGIATFTADLSGAISAEFTELDCFVLAMNDAGKPHAYTIGTDGDTIHLYYGAAGTCIALATGSVRELLGWLARSEETRGS